jgi:hypothetical protein
MNIKKIALNISIIVVALIAFGFYKHYTFAKPEILIDAHLNKAGITEEFEVSVHKKNYTIGLSVNDKLLPFSGIMDGNYTVEYYRNGKFEKKEFINQITLTQYHKDLWSISGSSSISAWKQTPLGRLDEPGNYKIKITVIKPEDALVNFKGNLYFFADKPNERELQQIKDTPEEREDWRMRKLLENLIDANETNQTLIPLRKALDSNEIEGVKKILKSDNNITVNTDMIFKRRALHYAAFHNNTALTKYLIAHGADIHHKDELGKNALAYAIENNATKTAKLLIESGVDVNKVVFVQNYLQYRIEDYKELPISPLQYAAGNALFEMTELLLQHKIVDKQVWLGGGKILTQDDKYELDYRLEDKNIYKHGLESIEREKMLKLFEKYNFTVPRPTQSQQIGY